MTGAARKPPCAAPRQNQWAKPQGDVLGNAAQKPLITRGFCYIFLITASIRLIAV